MSPIRYFVAVFGNPDPPEKDTVESGIYHPGDAQAPFPTSPGDVLLLYCTGSYLKHPMEAPGIGIVLSTDRETVKYRYLPLSQPISIETIRQGFSQSDASKLNNIRFDTFRVFEISRESFAEAMNQQAIRWP